MKWKNPGIRECCIGKIHKNRGLIIQNNQINYIKYTKYRKNK